MSGLGCFHSLVPGRKRSIKSIGYGFTSGIRQAHAAGGRPDRRDHSFPDEKWAETFIDKHKAEWRWWDPALQNGNPVNILSRVGFFIKPTASGLTLLSQLRPATCPGTTAATSARSCSPSAKIWRILCMPRASCTGSWWLGDTRFCWPRNTDVAPQFRHPGATGFLRAILQEGCMRRCGRVNGFALPQIFLCLRLSSDTLYYAYGVSARPCAFANPWPRPPFCCRRCLPVLAVEVSGRWWVTPFARVNPPKNWPRYEFPPHQKIMEWRLA